MTTKADLHQLIDALSDDALAIVARFLAELEEDAAAPYTPLESAPPDDEPTTPEEDASAAEAWQEYRDGKGRSLAEVRVELLRRRA
jgi:hypothetical protein